VNTIDMMKIAQKEIEQASISGWGNVMQSGIDRITALEAERDALREGLRGMYEDTLEYQRINNLGGYDNHWMKIARALLNNKDQSGA